MRFVTREPVELRLVPECYFAVGSRATSLVLNYKIPGTHFT